MNRNIRITGIAGFACSRPRKQIMAACVRQMQAFDPSIR